MKKITALLFAFALSAASAADTSTTVRINATVSASCVFDTSATSTSPASFSYTAAGGSAGATSGKVTLYCSSGTLSTVTTSPLVTPITLTGAAPNNSKTLMADVSLGTPVDTVITSGTYAGGDQRVYTLTPSAAANQGDAPAGTYVGAATITVTF